VASESARLRLWHGGVPGVGVGGLVEGGHERRALDGCPWCEARSRGETPALDGVALDGPSHRPAEVYLTSDREYARHYASLYGRGDLYRVVPVGDLAESAEDSFPTWTAPAARVVAVYARAVLLTWSQRRALYRAWALADDAARRA
jgi:hypothetical protein